MEITRHLFMDLILALVLLMVSVSCTAHNESEQSPRDVHLEKATFAGGCFWCMEPPFDELEGVVSTTSGYTGGQKKDPTYKDVSAGGTGHTEAVEILCQRETNPTGRCFCL